MQQFNPGDLIQTTNGYGAAVVLRATSGVKPIPRSDLMGVEVELVSTNGPFFSTGWHVIAPPKRRM